MIPYFTFREIYLGPAVIQVWGLAASIGFLAALFVSIKEAKKKNINEEYIWDVAILALFAMIVGSKVFYLVSDFTVGSVLSGGGFSFLGGVFLAMILCYTYAVLKKIDIWKLADVLVPGAVIALIIVRVGCFLVYDHVGKIVSLPWGMQYIDNSIRHPVSLYLILKGIFAFGVILYTGKKKFQEGVLFLAFAFYYAIVRFFLDFARCDDLAICDSRYFGLTYTQWFLLIAIPVVVFLVIKKHKINKGT